MTEAYIFPGQGSQSPGMLAELVEMYPIIQDSFSLASDIVGHDLWSLIQYGPEADLNKTVNTQVIMLAADVAIFRLLQSLNRPRPQWMAGHSLGEYAALVNAEALGFAEALPLVAKRGQLMQETVPQDIGAMAAIVGMTDEKVIAICAAINSPNEQVMPANFNAIGQVVIAGHKAAVYRAMEQAEQEGARLAKVIPVSVPCHCPLLADAAEAFADALGNINFKTPNSRVISNVDLSIYSSAQQIRALLKTQLVSPVRWVETIQLMKSQGVTKMIESGPGKVLSGLVKRIDKSITVSCVQDKASLENVIWEGVVV